MTAGSTAPPTLTEASPNARVHRLHRSRTNRVLAGVCGGIAEYYGSDPTAVRLATLIIGLFTGVVPMVLVYIVAAVVVPDGDGVAVPGQGAAANSSQTAMVLGALLVLIGIAGIANVWLHVDWDRVWPLGLIGLGALMVVATVRPRS